jgi:lysophospholipase L1-like esterase
MIPSGKLKLAGYEFRFLSENRLLRNNSAKKVDVKKVIQDIDTSSFEDKFDSLANKQIMGMPGVANFKIEESNLLAYDENGAKSLKSLFTKLRGAASKKIRILHYGDSQIEGDRMTSFLRQRLQEQFGGNGPGFIPTVNVYNTVSFIEKVSPNFKRYTNFGGDPLTTSNHYGILNTVGRFTPELSDTISLADLKNTSAWIEIEPNGMAYSRAKTYNNIYLHYTDAKTSCGFKVYQNGNLIVNDSLKADGKYHVYPLNFPASPGKIKLEFESKLSPNILGISLEGDIGVQVDNIAMRGSSGTFFGKIDQGLAKRIYNEQKVELFIMQFGGNSMPYITDSLKARQSANYFKGQLYTIKKLCPEATIVVIGPSDMSTLLDGEYTTYPILPYFVECLKKASKEVGGSYFDMYQAMGGKDAMVAWVENGLAAKDYIHFSNKGASIAAQKFYDAFMTAYTKLFSE